MQRGEIRRWSTGGTVLRRCELRWQPSYGSILRVVWLVNNDANPLSREIISIVSVDFSASSHMARRGMSALWILVVGWVMCGTSPEKSSAR